MTIQLDVSLFLSLLGLAFYCGAIHGVTDYLNSDEFRGKLNDAVNVGMEQAFLTARLFLQGKLRVEDANWHSGDPADEVDVRSDCVWDE